MNRPNWIPHPGAALVLTVLAALAGGLASLVVTGFNRTPTSHSMQVRELMVVDSKGVARAVLGSAPGGLFGLRLRDGKGRERMHLMLMADEPFGHHMRFSAAENQKTGLFTGAPSIRLYSQKGDPHAVLA